MKLIPLLTLLLVVWMGAAASFARAEGEGQADLDDATALKVNAESARDLEKVVNLCESAIKKGLDEQNDMFARQLLTSTLYENASLLTSQIFDKEEPDPRWPLMRQIAIPQLKKALQFNADMLDAHLLIARLQALPGGELEDGQRSADAAVKLAKSDKTKLAQALVLRAQLTENDDRQMADLNQAVKIDPANKDALRTRGLLRLNAGKDEEAIADFEQLIKVDGENATAYHAIAEAMTHLEKYKEARKYADKAIKLHPEQSLGYNLRARISVLEQKVDEALKDLDKAVEFGPRDISAHLLRARLLFEKEKFKEARDDVDRVLLLQPGLAQALLLRAMIHGNDQKYDDALRDLQKLVELDPTNTGYLLQMAAYLNASERPRAAIKVYDQVLAEDDADLFALRGRADAYLSVGDHAKAIGDYEQMLELDEKNSGALNNLAWVLATSTKDDVRDAKRAIKVATEACVVTDYKKAHILSTLAAAYAESGDFAEARKWSAKAVELAEGEDAEQLKKELESYKKEKAWREIQNVKEKPALGDPPGGSFEI
ncbi:tetratricopeptide repeat protein [Lignipirellula cremea]|uniref:Tetratricopeptide repeat protein n=1 Tax=Lignipirellula cremea TaxID=2528010 RepID=A0A518DSI9_9BACT|nr:tetratricopeptide repeat protein [Lignipirellula cremea]QDU94816.1 tetratricopeptide repeat protein [Lignipirellula cremea]